MQLSLRFVHSLLSTFTFVSLIYNTNSVSAAEEATLTSALFNFGSCSVEHVYRPRSTDEVLELVQEALVDKESTGRDFLIRAVRDNHFFVNNFSCIESSLNAPTVLIDTSEMDQILAVDAKEGWVTVQAGITFESLGEQLLEMGLGLEGIMISPPFAGMSVGEAIETASHSSSLSGPSTLGPHIKAAVLVDGNGQAVALDTPGDLLEGSMGLLGILTEVTLGVTQARKVLVKTLRQEDLWMLEDIREMVEQTQALSLDVTWSPAASLYTARVWYEAEEGHSGEAVNGMSISNEQWLNELEGLLIQDHEDHSDTLNIMCQLNGEWTAHPMHLKAAEDREQQEDLKELTADPGSLDSSNSVVGWSARMEASRCLGERGESCIWRRAKLTPHAFTIASEDLAPWSEDLRSIVSNTAGCPNFLVYLRFVMGSNAPLAMNSGRQMVGVDIQTLGSLKLSGRGPTRHQELLDEILQMSLCKYNARPHWSLSTNRMLVPGPTCPFSSAYGRKEVERFAKRMKRFDPQSLFLHPMFVKAVEEVAQDYYPGCAVMEDCFCSQDEHCGGSGYKCLPGQAFPEYKVCRRERRRGHEEL